MEGTYPLPEAQLDRFLMKILVHVSFARELARIVDRTIQREKVPSRCSTATKFWNARCVPHVLVAPHVQDYASTW
jgi:MoxR-like ATPase